MWERTFLWDETCGLWVFSVLLKMQWYRHIFSGVLLNHLSGVKKAYRPRFAVVDNFCRLNNPTTAHFKLPMFDQLACKIPGYLINNQLSEHRLLVLHCIILLQLCFNSSFGYSSCAHNLYKASQTTEGIGDQNILYPPKICLFGLRIILTWLFWETADTGEALKTD